GTCPPQLRHPARDAWSAQWATACVRQRHHIRDDRSEHHASTAERADPDRRARNSRCCAVVHASSPADASAIVYEEADASLRRVNGLPYPPPPDVSITTRSPLRRARFSLPLSSRALPLRCRVTRNGAPSAPPCRP